MLKKIIVVDDEPQISKLLKTFLEQKTDANQEKLYEVNVFNGGNPCIEYLRNSGSADLIISDMRMPDGEGTKILKYIKIQGLEIPFLFMTGFSGDIDTEEMMVAEIESFLKVS
jgi:DNA-binding NtrC family response regulator